LRFGDEAACEGDIEVDMSSAGWRDHGHDKNPNFQNVKLHVVWDREESGPIPTLALKQLLDSPIAELAIWLSSDLSRQFPADLLGNCCAPLRELGPTAANNYFSRLVWCGCKAKRPN
jgi:hypothetical protein